ncbi:iron chelate uptake ABC transporter family permease subunit [Rhodovulum sp. DZ06]|uniref:iron chelate uptake ABC transporter family permease subunit n=1 Tax=Rhodovulum sp. DZ06 TaxID=3425126 RepID=UPI003D3421B9
MAELSMTAAAAAPRPPRIAPGARVLLILAALLGVAGAGYMLIGAEGAWAFLLPFRAAKLAQLALVGAAISVATILFQTAAGARILTPSALGFDALYVFTLTALVSALGGAGFSALPPALVFALNLGAMTLLGMLLFGLLLRRTGEDLVRLVLAGVVLGILIRALTNFLQRMIDPADFQIVQALSFARFTQADTALLAASSAACLPAFAAAWALRRRLDVLALGPVTAAGLGEPPAPLRRMALALTCVLTAAATALVGPLSGGMSGPSAFFGLVVSAFVHAVLPSARHALLLPAAALSGALLLVAGQLAMERIFALATPVTAVIEVIGGGIFLWLLVKGRLK